MRNAVVVQTQPIASANLAAIPLQEKFSVSCVVNFTVNDGAGTLKIQVSNDAPIGLQPEQFVPTNWVDLSGASVTVASGATSIIPKVDVCYQYMRLVWTRTGGTGSFTVNTNVQGI